MTNFTDQAQSWCASLQQECSARNVMAIYNDASTLVVDLFGIGGRTFDSDVVNRGIMVNPVDDRQVIRLVCMPSTTPGDDGWKAIDAHDSSSMWWRACEAANQFGISPEKATLNDGVQILMFTQEVKPSDLDKDPYTFLEAYCRGVNEVIGILQAGEK